MGGQTGFTQGTSVPLAGQSKPAWSQNQPEPNLGVGDKGPLPRTEKENCIYFVFYVFLYVEIYSICNCFIEFEFFPSFFMKFCIFLEFAQNFFFHI